MDVNWNVCVQLREQNAKGLAKGSILFKSRVEAVFETCCSSDFAVDHV